MLSAQATVLVETADARRAFYDETHEACLESSDSFEAYRECMAPAYGVARAADAYDSALRAAQASLDASDADGFERALPCLVEAAARLAEALSRASIAVPEGVQSVLALGSSLAGACGEDAGSARDAGQGG